MIQKYWQKFLADTKRESSVKCAGVVCFGMDTDTCGAAVEKILNGEMRCRIYPADGYRKAMSGEAQAGQLNIVVDWKGVPCAVIETVKTSKMNISAITDDICAMEGMQTTLEEWREKQMRFIKAEVEELGGEFNDDTFVTVEEIRKIFPVE